MFRYWILESMEIEVVDLIRYSGWVRESPKLPKAQVAGNYLWRIEEEISTEVRRTGVQKIPFWQKMTSRSQSGTFSLSKYLGE
jgi:hypothetical protein